jgi:hypothetical protein
MVVVGNYGFIKVDSWHFGPFRISLGHIEVILGCFGAILGYAEIVSGHIEPFQGCFGSFLGRLRMFQGLSKLFLSILGRFEVFPSHFKVILRPF